MKALIFNIQKFSLNDGPGIRTVIFFKACPLRCKWCANPESQSKKAQILWDADKCLSCGKCQERCPSKAITVTPYGIKVNEIKCTGCNICVKNCPSDALSSEGELKTVGEVVKICKQDLPFYQESGGGVTLSGGEALIQHEFVCNLMDNLHKDNIHIAIETTGYAEPKVFNLVTSKLDLLLFDIKHWNDEKHREGTGVSNNLIINNLKYAVSLGKDVLPRIPVIPDFNDSLTDAKEFSNLLREIGLFRVQLLPFHQFGEKKYVMLKRNYTYKDIPALHEEELKSYQKVFIKNGINAFF